MAERVEVMLSEEEVFRRLVSRSVKIMPENRFIWYAY